MSLPCNKHIISRLSKVYRHTKRKLSFWKNEKVFSFTPADASHYICYNSYTIFTISIIIGNDNNICFLIGNTSHLRTLKDVSLPWRTKYENSSSARDCFHKSHGAVERVRCMSKINKVVHSTMGDLLHTPAYSMK